MQICLAAVEGDARLVNQQTLGEWVIGQPEIFILGSWHQVCSVFRSQGPTVACRQLGYGAASLPTEVEFTPEFEETEFTAGSLAVERFVEPAGVIVDLNCSGTEVSLLDCSPGRGRMVECRQSPSGAGPAIACVTEAVSGTRSWHTVYGANTTLNEVCALCAHGWSDVS